MYTLQIVVDGENNTPETGSLEYLQGFIIGYVGNIIKNLQFRSANVSAYITDDRGVIVHETSFSNNRH